MLAAPRAQKSQLPRAIPALAEIAPKTLRTSLRVGRGRPGASGVTVYTRTLDFLPCTPRGVPQRSPLLEANVPTQEAQARPYARLSCSYADSRRPVDDPAPPQEGALAADRLTGAGQVERSHRETRHRRPRLSKSADFDRVYRKGRSVASRHLVLYAFPRADEEDGEDTDVRLGVSVGRKVAARWSAIA